MNTRRKGVERERKLANYFWERGCAVLRGCSSGGGVRRRFVPDLIAICRGRVLVFEVKYRSRHAALHVERERLEKLLEFARRAGGEAYLLVKYSRGPWRVLSPAEVVRRDDYETAPELRAFLESIASQRLV
ncbi:MAG: Holliday junction resolvase [Thermoproteaceae archaeon]|jgi:Holliday junction resolvase|nr:Holliday junction resolvase [Thermoproteaceae archaeon]